MTPETDHDFHLWRARCELELAFRAESRAVSDSHLRLSALHMKRLYGQTIPEMAASNTEQGEMVGTSS